MKLLKEWSFRAPWGDIALVSWGDENGQPVLLVHGRQDSAATFQPLLNFLPEHYHYVALDFPGHGQSTPFPHGVAIARIHFVAAIIEVINHLKWRHFIYMAHSMGSEVGLLYNVIYPERITKFVLLDPSPALQRLQQRAFPEWFQTFYADYYDNYKRYEKNTKIYKKQDALEAVQKARNLNRAQAELVLSRNLIPVGEDMYRLSWDKRLKFPATMNMKDEYYLELFKNNSPPTLVISAKDNQRGYMPGLEAVKILLQNLQKSIKVFKIIEVEGNHDVHLTNPERIAGFVKDFLLSTVETKAKL